MKKGISYVHRQQYFLHCSGGGLYIGQHMRQLKSKLKVLSLKQILSSFPRSSALKGSVQITKTIKGRALLLIIME